MTTLSIISITLALKETNEGKTQTVSADVLEHRLKLVQDTLTKYTQQLAALRLENTDLWKKLELLEEAAKKPSNDLRDCREESKQHQESEEYYKKELGQFLLEASKIQKASREVEQKLQSCTESNDKLKARNQETDKVQAGNESSNTFVELQEKLLNCDETIKIIRERCDRDAGELLEIQSTHNKIRKKEAECSKKLTRCTEEKEHLEFLKRGYDLVVQELETDEKNAKEGKDRCEEVARIAVAGMEMCCLLQVTNRINK